MGLTCSKIRKLDILGHFAILMLYRMPMLVLYFDIVPMLNNPANPHSIAEEHSCLHAFPRCCTSPSRQVSPVGKPFQCGVSPSHCPLQRKSQRYTLCHFSGKCTAGTTSDACKVFGGKPIAHSINDSLQHTAESFGSDAVDGSFST